MLSREGHDKRCSGGGGWLCGGNGHLHKLLCPEWKNCKFRDPHTFEMQMKGIVCYERKTISICQFLEFGRWG